MTSENLSFSKNSRSFFRTVNKMIKTPIFESPHPPDRRDFKKSETRVLTDWYGQPLDCRPSFLFWLDYDHLHFWAKVEGAPGFPHPKGKPGSYQAELWKFDVAEFFLATPDRSRYLEFNLSPTGSWWSCLFGERLVPEKGEPQAIAGVRAEGRQTESCWEAHASLPREWIEEHFALDQGVGLNTTFILNSPDQIFASAADLGPGEPDFHRPSAFPVAKLGPPA